jgi:CheY-like chemotaxis protein
LREVLSHLIANALKFTTEGVVEVSASAFLDDDHSEQLQLVAAVRDTGAGVPPDKLDAIFESFRQLDCGLSRSHSGLGLGLALSRKIVELMGGAIQVESEPGKGSVFTITVPLRAAMDSIPERDVERSQPAQILVVEDNDVAQKVVRHMLTRGGYECVCVSSAPDAIETAKNRQFDLVLMDLQLPGISGIDASDALRELPAYRNTPIVAFTANSSDEFRSLCAEHGMQGFIAKPVQSHELLSVLAELLARTPLFER